MKINVVTMAVVAFDQAIARVESWYRQGCVQLVSIQCDRCGMWVEVAGWDPEAGTCDWCVSDSARRRKAAAQRRRGRRRNRSGSAR